VQRELRAATQHPCLAQSPRHKPRCRYCPISDRRSASTMRSCGETTITKEGRKLRIKRGVLAAEAVAGLMVAGSGAASAEPFSLSSDPPGCYTWTEILILNLGGTLGPGWGPGCPDGNYPRLSSVPD